MNDILKATILFLALAAVVILSGLNQVPAQKTVIPDVKTVLVAVRAALKPSPVIPAPKGCDEGEFFGTTDIDAHRRVIDCDVLHPEREGTVQTF